MEKNKIKMHILLYFFYCDHLIIKKKIKLLCKNKNIYIDIYVWMYVCMCKDWIWVGPKIELEFCLTSTNNEFVKSGWKTSSIPEERP